MLVGFGTVLFYALCSNVSHINPLEKSIKLLIGILLIIPAYYLLNNLEFFIDAFFVLLLLFYSPTFSNQKTLREIPMMKSLLISICWTFFTLIAPIWLTKKPLSFATAELVLMLLLFYALTIPSDIRDMNTDPKSMKTLPQLTGSRGSGAIGMVLVGLFGIGNFLISGEVILIYFSAFAIFTIGIYLIRRTALLLLMTDSLLIVLGMLFFCC
jgi:hypothetical protein